MARVELKSIQKSFGDTRVLTGIDLEIPDGEYVVLVGPSGCGKSTLLRCIAGLETVSGGELTIGDRRVNDLILRGHAYFYGYANFHGINQQNGPGRASITWFTPGTGIKLITPNRQQFISTRKHRH